MRRYRAILLSVAALASGAQACGGDDNGAAPGDDSGTPDSTVVDGGNDASRPDASGGKNDGGGDATTKDGGREGGAQDADAAALCTAFDAGRLDEASVAQGMMFVQNTGRCFRCHQSDPDAAITLSGNNASISDGGMVFPPNLTPDLMTGLGCLSNDQIANAILFGKDPMGDGGMLCVMPKYGVDRVVDGATVPGPLDASSVTSVVEYLRSLAAVHNQVPETVCPMTPPPADSGTEGGSSDAGDTGASDASDAAASDAATEASDAATDASDAAADASDAAADASDAGADASDAAADVAPDEGSDAAQE